MGSGPPAAPPVLPLFRGSLKGPPARCARAFTRLRLHDQSGAHVSRATCSRARHPPACGKAEPAFSQRTPTPPGARGRGAGSRGGQRPLPPGSPEPSGVCVVDVSADRGPPRTRGHCGHPRRSSDLRAGRAPACVAQTNAVQRGVRWAGRGWGLFTQLQRAVCEGATAGTGGQEEAAPQTQAAFMGVRQPSRSGPRGWEGLCVVFSPESPSGFDSGGRGLASEAGRLRVPGAGEAARSRGRGGCAFLGREGCAFSLKFPHASRRPSPRPLL